MDGEPLLQAAFPRSALEEQLSSTLKAMFFEFEGDKMYTKRETGLMQVYGLAGRTKTWMTSSKFGVT